MAFKIIDIIDEIEGFIEHECKPAFMDKEKVVVDKNTLLELLQELKDNVPQEIATYQKVISNRNAILENAKLEADEIITKANRNAESLLDENSIMQKAYQAANKLMDDANNRAADIVDKANNEANTIISSGVSYTDNLLASLETLIKHSIDNSNLKFEQYIDALKNNLETVSNNRYELSRSINSHDTNA